MAIFDPRKGVTDSIVMDYRLPNIIDPEGLAAYKQLIDAPDGMFIFTFRSDTLYFINNDMKIRPRFVDQSYNMNSRELYSPHLYPIMETSEYVFFTLIFSHITHPDERLTFFVYDKRKSQFFRLKQLPDKDKMENQYYYWQALLEDSPELMWYMITMNHNYAGALIDAHYLIEHKEILSEPLREIASTLDEYDNPILMLIKFR